MTQVAIVILNWNGSEMLQKFLPSVVRYSQEAGMTVYVADNGSTDASVEMLSEVFPMVKCILLKKNYGYAGGYNEALRQIEADYYVLLNSDVEVTEGWLRPMIDYLEQHLDVAGCQPKIKSWHNKEDFEYAGACGGFMDRYGYPFCRGRVMQTVEEDHGQYDEVISVFWASGAALVVRASDYWEVGGLDSRFFAHMEEIDLCWRLMNRNKRLVCLPFSTVYHVGGGTLQKENPRKTHLNFRNSLLMLYKNLPPKEMNAVLIPRFFLDYLAMFVFVVKGEFANAKAVVSARREFGKMKKELACEREKSSFFYKSTRDLTGWMRYSILIQYYLRGKKYYSQL